MQLGSGYELGNVGFRNVLLSSRCLSDEKTGAAENSSSQATQRSDTKGVVGCIIIIDTRVEAHWIFPSHFKAINTLCDPARKSVLIPDVY